VVAASCALALLAGAPVVGAMPVGLFATAVQVIGLNLLAGSLIDHRRAMPAGDVLVLVLIPLVAAGFGFLWGVAAGLLAVSLLFVLAFARNEVVRLATTVGRLRSRVERPEAAETRLAALGPGARVYALEGYLFFGTAHRLARRIEAALAAAPAPSHVLIDFGRVWGLDTSAARAVAGLAETCRGRGSMLVLSGLPPAGERLVRRHRPEGARFAPRLGAALETVEAELFAAEGGGAGEPGLVEALQQAHPALDVAAYFRAVTVPAGAEVITQGAPSDSLLVMRSGALRIEVSVEGRPA